jgi:hypothetical protein
MLQAHSFLWNYLWVAPNVFLWALAVLLWRRGLARQIPVFFAFAILSGASGLAIFVADVLPSVSPLNFWRIDWICLVIESFLKFVVIGEVFSRIFSPYPTVSRTGAVLASAVGAALVLLSGAVAGLAHGDSTFRIVAGAHLLEQTVFFVESGLIFFLFLFTAHFRLSWDRVSFGVLLGLGISACEHLATWAVIANASPSERTRTLLAFINMATYHFAVLIWCYCLLKVGKVAVKSATPLPENNLALWNRELERLLQ